MHKSVISVTTPPIHLFSSNQLLQTSTITLTNDKATTLQTQTIEIDSHTTKINIQFLRQPSLPSPLPERWLGLWLSLPKPREAQTQHHPVHITTAGCKTETVSLCLQPRYQNRYSNKKTTSVVEEPTVPSTGFRTLSSVAHTLTIEQSTHWGYCPQWSHRGCPNWAKHRSPRYSSDTSPPI